MENTIDDEREDPFVSLSDSDVEQEATNELDSDDAEWRDYRYLMIYCRTPRKTNISTQFFLATSNSLY